MQQEKYLVSEHASKDAFPLRFGLIPPKYVGLRNITIDTSSTDNQKPKEIKAGNYHVVAECYDLESNQSICTGRFVISSKQKYYLYQKIITAFGIEPSLAERGVSDLIRKLREENEIDTDFIIANLHKPYATGIIKDEIHFSIIPLSVMSLTNTYLIYTNRRVNIDIIFSNL